MIEAPFAIPEGAEGVRVQKLHAGGSAIIFVVHWHIDNKWVLEKQLPGGLLIKDGKTYAESHSYVQWLREICRFHFAYQFETEHLLMAGKSPFYAIV